MSRVGTVASGDRPIGFVAPDCDTAAMPRRWYEMLPVRRDVLTVKEYAAWLGQVPWKVFATLTFTWRVSDPQADRVFAAFINRLERDLRAPVAFVRGDEKRFSGCGMPGSPRHYHALMTSTAPLDRKRLETVWRGFGGSGQGQDSALVLDCEDPQNAAEYCLKFINETDGDWAFRNLDLFMPNGGDGLHRDKRRAARQLARAAPAQD